ncbi:MAG: hypothetical protein AAFR66_21750, partial [Bacteroidota bacterium]
MKQVFTACTWVIRLQRLGVLLLCTVFMFSCQDQQSPPFKTDPFTEVKTIKGLATPSAICTDGKYYYVASIGARLLPVTEDGDGYITKIRPDGEIVSWHFIYGLNAPSDLIIIDTTLLVSDIDRVKGFDLNSGEQLMDISYLGAMIDGIAYDGEEFLYATANITNRIYRTSLKTLNTQLFTDQVSSPNGIAFNQATESLLISQFQHDGSGKILSLSIAEPRGEPKRLGSAKGFLDGIQLSSEGTLFYSDWEDLHKAGRIGWIDPNTQYQSEISLPTQIQNPSDILFDESRRAFLVTDLLANQAFCFF